ncbi:beta-lactamase-like protein [Dipodascopsis uninucleata]
MFTFTTLVGASSASLTTFASQSLLTFDQNIKVLIDVGWDELMTPSLLDELERLTSSIDLILLTHATLSHIGAYAYACKKFPGFESIPVYATLPVINMARVVTIDAYSTAWFSLPVEEQDSTYAIEPLLPSNIDALFDKVHPLKYSQQLQLTGKLNSLSVTPTNAGHTLGGTVWRLTYGQEDVIYATDWNHAVERHLNSSSLLTSRDHISRPTALICSARPGSGIRKREELLVSAIMRGLDRGGSVILPMQTAGRALEMCHFLDAHWTENNISVPLYFVSRTANRTMAYARSMLEWMSPSIVREWEEKGTLPFAFQSLKMVTTLDEIPSEDKDKNKVILTSGASLEWGLSKEIFVEMCEDEKNVILFTQEAEKDTLSGEALAQWRMLGESTASDGLRFERISLRMEVEIRKTVALEGEELESFLATLKARQHLTDKQTAMELKNRNILEQEDTESESSSEEEEEATEQDEKEDLGILILTQDNDIYDYDVRSSKNLRNRMFPFVPRRAKRDQYGEIIRAEDFVRAEEKDDDDRRRDSGPENGYGENGSGSLETNIGKKRKWTDDVEEEKSSSQTPFKTVTEKCDIDVKSEVVYLDYEGLVDMRSMQMILSQIHPRKLILISGVLSQADELADGLRDTGIQDIYIPSTGKIVNASVDTNAYEVIISHELARELQWQKAGTSEYTIARIKGKLFLESTKDTSKTDDGTAVAEGEGTKDVTHTDTDAKKGDEKGDDQNLPSSEQENGGNIDEDQQQRKKEISLTVLNSRAELAIASSNVTPMFVGDVRLAELRRRLIAGGHHTEFRGEGVLLCDKAVVVRKMDDRNMLIEGGVGDTFYKVRSIVDSFLARIL